MLYPAVAVPNNSFDYSSASTQNRTTALAKGISADTKDGKLSHGLLLDEYHQHPDKKLYNSIALGRVADPTSMMLIITTAGTELGGVCHQEYEKCKLTESNLVDFQIPGDNVVALSRQLRKPLQDWIATGMVRALEVPVVDYLDVGNFIKACMELYNLRLIACDAWKLELFAAKVGDWFETIAARFSQSMKSMALPIEQFKEAYLTGLITSGDNPVMTWMMDCVDSSTDSNGNVKLTKSKLERTKTRIEGVIASIMSFNTAVDNEGQ